MNTPGTRQNAAGGFNPANLIGLLLRHAWVMLVVFIVVSVLASYVFKQTTTTIWRSTSVVMVQPMTPPVLGGNDPAVMMWSAFLDAQRYRSTQLRIMTSSALIQQVVDRLDLENDPEFPYGPAVDGVVNSTPVDLVQYIKSTVLVEQDADTMMVNITVSCFVPKYCADIANALADEYVRFNYEQRISAGASAENWLRQQYETRRKMLEEAEDALVEFRREKNLVSVSLDGEFNLTGQSLTTLASRLLEAEGEVDRLATTMREIQRVRQSGDFLSAGLVDVVENELVGTLKGQLVDLETERASLAVIYLDNHPQMKANAEKIALVRQSLEREIDAALTSQQIIYDTAANLAATIREKMSTSYNEALLLGDTQVEYERLIRALELNREVSQQIERRLQEVELANQLEPNNVQVMERAGVPTAAAPAKGLPVIVIALVAGLLAAFGVAFLIEMLDSTVKTQAHIEDDMQLPYLGIVPSMAVVKSGAVGRGPAPGQKYHPDTFVHEFPKSAMAEAMRSIRTNLMFMATDKPIKRILVTSAAPLEGKTTIAVSLATIYAQSRLRVLMVDNDLRRPRLHSALQIPNGDGVTSILAGERTIEECIVDTSIPGVKALTCGPIPNNPSDLMLSEQYRRLLDDLTEMFDLVVFDAPPVAPVTDAVQISQQMDGVLFVVRAGKTRKETFRFAIDQLDGVAAPILGVVLNDVDIQSRRKGYYYSYHQYSKYYGDA